MENKKAFQFEPNQPVEVLLTFDTPKTGQGQYGTWYLYGCEINGIKETFFATAKLHAKMQKANLKKGSKATIILQAKFTDDGKTYKDYELKVNGAVIKITSEEEQNYIQPFETDKERISKEEIQTDQKWIDIRDEKRHDIHIGMSFNKSVDMIIAGKIEEEQLAHQMDKFLEILKRY